MTKIVINDVSIKEYAEAKETKIRTFWEDGKLTSAKVVDLLQKLNRVVNAERELRTQLDTFNMQLNDALRDDELV